MTQRLPTSTGKGVFIWQATKIFGGNPKLMADELQKSGTNFVAIKIHNGIYQWPGLEPIFAEIRSRGISTGSWGYVYNNSDAQARGEVVAAVGACKKHKPDFYLIDAEGDAKDHPGPASIFASGLRLGLPNMPIGLCSYRYPNLHPELPWAKYLNFCDFVAPQVYWRGVNPVGNLLSSKKQYAALTKLPYYFAGGDMYLEKGVRPTNDQVTAFMGAVLSDPDIKGTLMWAMDPVECPADLWATYSAFTWDTELQKMVIRLGKFLDDAKIDVGARKVWYLSILQMYRQTSTMPVAEDPIEEAIFAGVKTMK